MAVHRVWVVAALMALSAGCVFGMTSEKLKVAHSPRGIEARVSVLGAEFVGELIEVRESGLVLLTSGTAVRRLRFIPFQAVHMASFAQLGRLDIRDGRRVNERHREALCLVSRFPQGLTTELLAELLSRYGQTELDMTPP